MPSKVSLVLRLITIATALVFLFSAALNLGVKVPLGSYVLSFSDPQSSIATFEILIGAIFAVSSAISRILLYGGAYFLAFVGITFGLFSPDVQGLARSLHLIMLPLALVGTFLLGLDARSSFNSRATRGNLLMNRHLITVLQFFVGGLVTLGGAAYARDGTYPVGTILGLIHLLVGITGIYAGYSFLKMKPFSSRFLIVINSITIGYSTFSEALAQIYSFLPPGFNDSLIGTLIALIVSGTIICLLILQPVKSPSTSESQKNGSNYQAPSHELT